MNTKPKIRVSSYSTKRDLNMNDEDNGDNIDTDTDEEVFSRQSAAGHDIFNHVSKVKYDTCVVCNTY